MASENLRTLYLGNAFGSGFIVKGDDGNMFVLTNRHVVMQAENVNIEFSNTDGSSVNYNNCKVVSIDNNNDLALIALPKNANINYSLNFGLKKPEDGQEVYSAGFPSMRGIPSWQLGKGIISNSNFSMEILDDEIKSNVIQHTAQIDRGSSGSPLLVKDQNEITGYSVIGLNTWKVLNRENANLTIPTSTIIEFLNKATHPVKIDNNSALEKELLEFTNNALHGYKKILKYISYKYIDNLDFESFYSYWENSTVDAQKEILSQFADGQPIDAIRITLADAIAQSIERNKKTFTFNGISSLVSNEYPTDVTFLLNDKPIKSSWIIEQNQWKIAHFSVLKTYDEKKLRKVKDYTYFLKLTPQFYISTSKAEQVGYGIDASVGEKWFFGMGLFKYSHRAGNEEYSSLTSTYELTGETGYVDYTQLSLNLGYQYPLQFSKVYITPFIKGSAGLNFGSFFSLSSHISYGIQTGYKFKNDKTILLHFEIAPRIILENDFFENNSKTFNKLLDTNTKFGGVNIGVAFVL